MKKSIKGALIISALVMILFLSISSIQAMDSDTVDDVVQDDNPAVPDVNNNENNLLGNGTEPSNGNEDNPSGNGTEPSNGTEDNPSGNGTEPSNGTEDNPSGNGTEQSNGTENNNTGNGTQPVAGTETNNTGSTTQPSTGTTNNAASTTKPTSTYNKLQQRIDNAKSGSVIVLNANYKFYSKSGDKMGIRIFKDITLKGNGTIWIDGSGVARGLSIGEGCKVTLENIIFKNCYCKDGNGGAIYLAKKCTLTVKNCQFKNNKVYNRNGAAIYGNEFSKIYIHKSKFLDNNAVRKSNKAWTAFKRGMGSTILVNRGSTLNIYDSTFKNNKAYVGTIIVVSYNDKAYALSTTHIKNCLFEKNTARGNGVIYLDEHGKGTFENSIFRNNKVTHDGSIVMLEASKYALVKNCKFEKNTAPDGAINLGTYGKKVSHVKITGSTFKGNKGTYGAAIFSNSGYLQVDKCKFYSNVAKKSGGAISTDKKGSLKISNSVFKYNSAIYGGAIFSTLKKVVSSHNTFAKNKAKKTGKDVFGRVYAKITKVGKTKMKVKLTSKWSNLLKQKFRLTAKGSGGTFYTKVLKTNSKGIVTGKLNGRVPSGTYKVSLIIPGIDLHFKKLTLRV